jgi:TPR repeat protein
MNIFIITLFIFQIFIYSKNIFNDLDIFEKLHKSCDLFEENCEILCDNILNNYENHLNLLKNFKNNTDLYNYLYDNPNNNITLLISEAYYYKGYYNFFGIYKKNPDLNKGFSYFIISSYLSNRKSHYKIFLILNSGLYYHIYNTSKFKDILNSNNFLKHIQKTKFYNNFNQTNNIQLNSISFSFLYSSALSKYIPAITAIAYKYLNGFGVEQNCELSSKYYKFSAYKIFNHLVNYKETIDYGNYTSLEDFESSKYKFSYNIFHLSELKDVIGYYKMTDDKKLKNTFLNEIGRRYLYGIYTKKDFKNAIEWFKKGVENNDPESMYYMGLIYLLGYGVKIDYDKAYHYFKMSVNNGYEYANIGLGYMNFYGLKVTKDVDKALLYFKNSKIENNEVLDGLYNLAIINLLNIESEKKKIVYNDFKFSYKIANYLASRNDLYGNYLFSMLNYYKIESLIDNCEINIGFFKKINHKNLNSIRKENFALKSFKEKKYQTAFLIYLELSYEGAKNTALNAGIILYKYPVFLDNNYQFYLCKKLLKLSLIEEKNIYAYYNLAMLYFNKGKYKKSIKYFKNMINIAGGVKDYYYLSQGYFNLGFILNFYKKDVFEQLDKKSNESLIYKNMQYKKNNYLNLSSNYYSDAIIPVNLVKNCLTIDKKIDINFKKIFKIFKINKKKIFFDFKFYVFILIVLLYLWFIIDLNNQKNENS